MAVHALVWLWARDVAFRRVLAELLAEAFTVRQCSGVGMVWNDLLAGQTGVLVADLTRLSSLSFADHSRLCSLSYVVPVLLLIDDPGLAYLARSETGRFSVLFDPFDDLDRLLAATVELQQHTSAVGTLALSAF